MHPILFKIGSFQVHTYGLLVALGVLCGIYLFRKNSEEAGLHGEEMTDFAVYIILAGMIGARIFYVLSDIGYYMEHPLLIIFSRSGFVFYGGFLGGGLTAAVIMLYKKYPLWKTLDALAPAAAIGHSIGRLGCFFQGCCFGKVTNSNLGIRFPAGSSCADYHLLNPITGLTPSVFPTQLIESIGLFLIFLILVLYKKMFSNKGIKNLEGQLILIYGFLYGALRFGNEFLRGDFRGSFFMGLSFSQWISIFVMCICIIFYILKKRKFNLDMPQ